MRHCCAFPQIWASIGLHCIIQWLVGLYRPRVSTLLYHTPVIIMAHSGLQSFGGKYNFPILDAIADSIFLHLVVPAYMHSYGPTYISASLLVDLVCLKALVGLVTPILFVKTPPSGFCFSPPCRLIFFQLFHFQIFWESGKLHASCVRWQLAKKLIMSHLSYISSLEHLSILIF